MKSNDWVHNISEQLAQGSHMDNLINELMDKYANKPSSQSDETWLQEQIKHEFPELPAQEIQKEADELATAAEHIQNLVSEVFESKNDCMSPEQWISSYVRKQCHDDDDVQQAGLLVSDSNEICTAATKQLFDDDDFPVTAHAGTTPDEAAATVRTGKKSDDPPIAAQNELSSALLAINSVLATNTVKVKINPNQQVIKGLHKYVQARYQNTIRQDVNVQFGNHLDIYDLSKLSYQLGRNAIMVGLGGIAIALSIQIIHNIMRNRKVLDDQHISSAMTTGKQASIKVVVICALKMGAARGLIPLLSKATPAIVLVSIASICMEAAKILRKYAQKEVSTYQVLDSLGRTSVAIVCGIAFSSQGAAIGAATMSFIPVVGSLLGAVIGGTIGNVASNQLIENQKIKELVQYLRQQCYQDYQLVKNSASRISHKNIQPETTLEKYKAFTI